MVKRTSETLELPSILDRLAQYASFSASHDLAIALAPSPSFEEVSRLQRLTAEARRLLDIRPNVSIAGARDVRDTVHRASLGGALEPLELLDISSTLACGRVIRSTLTRLAGQLPLLAEIAERIVVHEKLEREIARCITPKGEVADTATPILRRLRAEVRSAHQRLIERLEGLVNSAGLRHLIQEPIITQRGGRYVIPIKADFKGQFKGIVHDQSASGATVFVEPLETVDLNNRWRKLQLEEQREAQRVLRMLSSAVGDAADDLKDSVEALAEIDLALAKARYASALRAVSPRLIRHAPDDASDGGDPHATTFLNLINARHPLLGESVVPISIHLGGDFFILVITGPNTGGKTVALKTVGLLVLMAQCGLQIPADEGSALRVFSRVYADIGDEQSIEQSLSTFSSHMTRVLEVLKEADEESLALLDELGAGTDPAEGSALARAVLQYLVKRRVPTISTTHYSELKAFANATPGVENACVEFEPETLAPTFRLSIGLPGRSNAIAIARKLGVPTEVIESASGMLDPVETQADRLLAQIQSERDRIERERLAVERLKDEVEALKTRLDERLEAIEKERQAAVEKAWRQVEREVEETRERLIAALELEGQRADREQLAAALNEARQVQKIVDAKIAEPADRQLEPSIRARELQSGDHVLVKSLNQYGELISPPDSRGEAEVQLGSFKVKVRSRDLEPVRSARQPSGNLAATRTEVRLASRDAPPPQIEVRAWRVEQVLPVLEKYIHEAYLAGLPEVRVIHGKGTGVLRQVVREQLAQNPLVRSFRTAEPRDGGEGVTVVELAV